MCVPLQNYTARCHGDISVDSHRSQMIFCVCAQAVCVCLLVVSSFLDVLALWSLACSLDTAALLKGCPRFLFTSLFFLVLFTSQCLARWFLFLSLLIVPQFYFPSDWNSATFRKRHFSPPPVLQTKPQGPVDVLMASVNISTNWKSGLELAKS